VFSIADKAWIAGLIALGSQYLNGKYGIAMSPEFVAALTAAGVYFTPNKGA
jgi:hypothetical protein